MIPLIIAGCHSVSLPQSNSQLSYTDTETLIPNQIKLQTPSNLSTLTPATISPSIPKIDPTPSAHTSSQYSPNAWMQLPVIPEISQNVIQIYHHGLELGNRPNAFSKVGDCGSTPSWFLGDFDRGERFYNLGKYTYLQKVIDYYHGSFDRTSLAALAGYNTSSVLTPLWSNKKYCGMDESPLECEYRIQRPALALITLGANDVFHMDSFETQMRKIIEISIQNGIIPILATKPDNAEGDHRINRIITALAKEYDIPLWNYWLAVQPLPNHGLQEDGVHITFAPNDFSNPLNLEAGWPIRNLTALQVLDALYNTLQP
ncbi:MAG: SGNH/GDSL hydrolase family protein [Anaerolineales bacterium]